MGTPSDTARRAEKTTMLTTTLYATIRASKEALDHLGPGSSIIPTTSIQAYQPAPPLPDYAATPPGEKLEEFGSDVSGTALGVTGRKPVV